MAKEKVTFSLSSIAYRALRALAQQDKKTMSGYIEEKILEEVVVIPKENKNSSNAGFKIIPRDISTNK